MSLILTIHDDANLEFFQFFDTLTTLQKKIFTAVQWWVRKFPTAYPKQETIADHIGCSRKYVNQVLKKFQGWGWVYLTSRGKRRTKILGLCQHLVLMEVSKREYLRKLEVTSEVTHSSYSIKKYTAKEKTGAFSQVLKIADHVKNLGISVKNKLKLSSIPQNFYHIGLEVTKAKHAKTPFKSSIDIESYVVGVAIRQALQKGFKVPWRQIYETFKQMGDS